MKQAIFCVDLHPCFFLLLFHTEKYQCGTMGPGGTTHTAELYRTSAPGPHFSTHADIFFILWFQFCNVGPRQLAAPRRPKPKSIRQGRLWHGFSSRTQQVHDTHMHGSTVILCGRLIGFNFVYVGSFLCHLREYSSARGPITASLCEKGYRKEDKTVPTRKLHSVKTQVHTRASPPACKHTGSMKKRGQLPESPLSSYFFVFR